jgi:EmrB/QacA subfamily drug resistance transporter
MIVLDVTIVNVALPSIKADLGFSEVSLVWVVNAYLLTFGGFLLLGGRLGDLFGHRRLFLLGIAFFTVASLGCGLASSQGLLVGARAVQGLGGAVVSAVALSLTMLLFVDTHERAKAMGIFGFVSAGGGSLGLLLGGTLTSALNWHWIFLVNLPIGALVYALGLALLPDGYSRAAAGRLDIAGAITVTTSLMLAVYAIATCNESGSSSARTISLLATATVLLIVFLGIEARARAPLMPLSLFRLRNRAVANAAGLLAAAAMFAWCFISALYLQRVLGYSPLQVGFAFLPANLITAGFSLGLSARLVIRFGIKPPLTTGLLLVAAGLVLFARAPVGGNLIVDVLSGMLLLGLGGGMAVTPLLLAATSGVAPGESGLASGVVNTAFTMGGALGLAIVASIAGARTNYLLASGVSLPLALNSGYHVAFFMGALFAAAAALLGAALLRTGHGQQVPVHDHEKTGATLHTSICDD